MTLWIIISLLRDLRRVIADKLSLAAAAVYSQIKPAIWKLCLNAFGVRSNSDQWLVRFQCIRRRKCSIKQFYLPLCFIVTFLCSCRSLKPIFGFCFSSMTAGDLTVFFTAWRTIQKSSKLHSNFPPIANCFIAASGVFLWKACYELCWAMCQGLTSLYAVKLWIFHGNNTSSPLSLSWCWQAMGHC